LNYVPVSNPHVPIFLGYCAKAVWVPTSEWAGGWGSHVTEIASVSGCISSRAPDWIDSWDFNRSTCWNGEGSALARVPQEKLSDFRLFCYRLVPVLFDVSGEPVTVSLDELFPSGFANLPDEPNRLCYRSLGYDVVESPPLKSSILGFGCSPLSCNGMAEKIAVNRYCLLDRLDDAFSAAKRFGVEQPEPGPYVVIEVLEREG
jgi:hypothetical protein